MPSAKIVYSPEAEAQLVNLYHFVAKQSSPAIAQKFTNLILERCDELGALPLQGVARDDIRHGLRMVSIRRRATIACSVEPRRVTILGLFYGGQDYATLLKDI